MIGLPAGRLRSGEWMRAAANWANLSTPAGLVLARAAGCRVRRGAGGLRYALGYRPPLPAAGAFTVGNVVFFRPAFTDPDAHPALVAHEGRHCTQYALCLGLPFLPLYFAAAGWSWLRTGDPASRNVFERAAGLQAGGYAERPPRPLAAALGRSRSRGDLGGGQSGDGSGPLDDHSKMCSNQGVRWEAQPPRTARLGEEPGGQ
jgi:hypothetical protein